MKFKVDENLPVEIVDLLRQADYDATSVTEQEMSGAPDASVASVCQKENRVILTLDTDFSDIRTYPPDQYAGLVVFRLKKQDKFSVLEIVRRVMRLFSDEKIRKKLWIVEENRIRIKD